MNEQQFFVLLLCLTCAYALWKGGAPERISAVAFLAATAMTVLSTLTEMHRYLHVETGVILTDLLLLALLLGLAMRSTRWWPLFVAGFQLDGVVVHAMRMVAPDTIQLAYLYGTVLWSYPMVLLLAAGTWRHQERLRRYGSDPPWSAQETVSSRA